MSIGDPPAPSGHGALAADALPPARRTGEELLAREEQLRQAIHVAQLGFFDHDHITDHLYWSPRATEICGVPAGHPFPLEAFGRLIHPDDQEAVLHAIQQAHDPQGDGVYAAEYRLVRPDGTVRWVLARSQTTFASDGSGRRPLRTIGAIMDVSEGKALQARLAEAQRLEAIGRLAGGVAHDFNNLLTVIRGFTEVVRGQFDPTDDAYGSLTLVLEAATSATRLTQQLLAYSGRQVLNPHALDLNSVIEGMRDLLQRLVGDSVALRILASDEPAWVQFDPSQYEQVLISLATRARSAMPDGGSLTIEVLLSADERDLASGTRASEPGAVVEVRVSDTGIDLDDAERAHLFEPFFASPGTGRGRGLELSMVFGVVSQHGGAIGVAPTPNGGTTITLRLPRLRDGDTARGHDSADTEIPRGHEAVLLVEDEEGVRRVAVRVLTTLGYRVTACGSAEEALQTFARHDRPADLVITDVILPGMNGRDLAERLRERWPPTRVLFTSGYTDQVLAGRDVSEGGWTFLQKPYSVDELARAVRNALDRDGAPRA